MTVMDLLLGAAALGLLLLPGWIAARALQVPQPLLAGFIASMVALVGVILALGAAGVSLTFGHCGSAWLLLTLATGWLGRKAFRPAPAVDPAPPLAWREHWPLFLALVPAVAVVAYRARFQPLFGIDTVFRWNFLAQQMVTHHSLGFYPPVTAGDYEIYSWPDGIAPTVSSLYFWTYALAGATRPALTAVSVIFQYVILVGAAFALARRLFSDRAAVFAGALVAGSPVIGWATAMGQETGLTALALTALLLYLPRDRSEETTGTIMAAGLAAGLGALAREYGLALIALGFGLILARRLSVRSLVLFTGVAALAALPWYVRNWLHTGNPFFNLEVAGWFPVNRAHVWLMQSYQAEFGWSRQPPAAYTFLLANCWVALLGGLAGAWFYFRPARALLAASALIVVLWATSLGYTAAGFTTALRVLSPALVLGAVLGGGACARFIPGRRYLAVAGLSLGLVALDAALRALTLPGPVYKIPPADWLSAGGAVHEYHARPVYARIAQFAGAQRLLVLGPNALLTLQGARTVPLWSPEVAFVFDRRLTPGEIARRLRVAGFGYILLNLGPANERFLAHSAYFLDPGDTLRAVAKAEEMILLKIVDAP